MSLSVTITGNIPTFHIFEKYLLNYVKHLAWNTVTLQCITIGFTKMIICPPPKVLHSHYFFLFLVTSSTRRLQLHRTFPPNKVTSSLFQSESELWMDVRMKSSPLSVLTVTSYSKLFGTDIFLYFYSSIHQKSNEYTNGNTNTISHVANYSEKMSITF